MRARLLLLGGQTLALGLTVAFLVVPAAALMLHAYGASVLPYAYLVVAVAGVAVSWAMRSAQARLSLAALAVTVLVTYVVLVAAGYLLLTVSSARWVTFGLFVLFPIAIPVGFVLVGAQGGRLLDVREMKEYFPRIVGGFSVGFGVGGLVAAWLAKALPGPTSLLLVDLVPAVALLALVVATARRHPEQMRARPPAAPVVVRERRGRWQVPLSRLVLVIFGYQLLSAMVSYLLDYVVLERSAARYPDAGDLARFTGLYDAAINVTAIAFVVLLAGRLFRRFGVGLGLAANPAVVVCLLVVGNAVGWWGGIAGLLFLLIACGQQIGDLATTDGMTRTAINATYQALPPDERLRSQTMVEGAGVPLALGLVGALLLLFRAAGLGVRTVELVGLLVSLVWLGLALAAYREYGVGLRALVTRRTWAPARLEVSSDAALDAVRRLLASPDPRDVEVGLHALADSRSRALAPEVGALLADETSGDVRGTAARAWLAGGEGGGHAEVGRLLDDPDPWVRSAAAAALVGAEQPLATRARAVWTAVLHDADPATAGMALRAAAVTPDPFFVPALVEAADEPLPQPALAQALAAHADHLGPSVGSMILERHGSRRVRERLARAVTAAAGRVPPVSLDLPTALGEQRARAARVRAALRKLGHPAGDTDGAPTVDPLRRALLDELADIAGDTTTILALTSGQPGLGRAVRALGSDDSGQRALAVEALEVTAGRGQAPWVMSLVKADPTVGVPDEEPTPTDWLADLVDDPDRLWQEPWLRVCALYAAPALVGEQAAVLAGPWRDDADPAVAETARWVIDRLGGSGGGR